MYVDTKVAFNLPALEQSMLALAVLILNRQSIHDGINFGTNLRHNCMPLSLPVLGHGTTAKQCWTNDVGQMW